MQGACRQRALRVALRQAHPVPYATSSVACIASLALPSQHSSVACSLHIVSRVALSRRIVASHNAHHNASIGAPRRAAQSETEPRGTRSLAPSALCSERVHRQSVHEGWYRGVKMQSRCLLEGTCTNTEVNNGGIIGGLGVICQVLF